MFLNAVMLAGLGAAVLPLVLHLLSRSRYRTVDWGAMMFLQPRESRQRHSTRLKQVALLGTRMAAIALLAIALARPVLHGQWSTHAEQGRVTAVIILDRSLSMTYEESGQPRFDAAKQAVLNILAGFRRDDEVALVLMGDESDPGNAPLTTDLQALASHVADLRPATGRADIATALYQAIRIFSRDSVTNPELYLVCDRQASSWDGINETFATGWNITRKRLPVAPRLLVIPIGGEHMDNVSLDSLTPTRLPLIKDVETELELRVRNYGSLQRAALPLVISAGGREIHKSTINLTANSVTTVRVPVRFPASGSQVVSARVTTSGFTADDQIDAAVDVLDAIRVLIVSGDERSGVFRSESDFLRLALMPYKNAGERTPDAANVRVIEPDQWPRTGLDGYHVLVLANVAQLSLEHVREIEQFVYAGGGLMVAPGNLLRVEHYNETMFRGGGSLLPAQLSAATSHGGQDAILASIERTHPVFQFLANSGATVPSTPVARYCPVTHLLPDARIMARLSTDEPLLIDRPYGRGRVILLTTTIDADWNALPMSNLYLPMMQSAVRYLAGGVVTNRNLAPGEPLEARFDDAVDENALLARPRPLSTIEVPLTKVGTRVEARYTQTSEPGVYVLRVRTAKGERRLHFVVRAPRDQSDLTPLPRERWQWIEQALRASIVEPDREKIAAAAAAQRSGRELWPILLGGVLVLLGVELGLARLWSREVS